MEPGEREGPPEARGQRERQRGPPRTTRSGAGTTGAIRTGTGTPEVGHKHRGRDTGGPPRNLEKDTGKNEGISKQDIRERIWDYMESENLADFPRPVHHRIPNFKGSYLACQSVRDLDVFARTQEVKVDPDKPLEGVRLLALQSKKTLLVPTPRLRTGLFNRITPPPGATKDILRKCATSQVVDIPEALLEDHDLTVDYILTPTRVICTGCERPKPAGITWSKISCEMLEKIPILRSLRDREKQAGKNVTLQAEHQPLLGSASQHSAPRSTIRRPPEALQPVAESLGAACGPLSREDMPAATVYVGNLPRDVRVSDLRRALRELGVVPLRLTWQGSRCGAFLHYQDPAAAQQAISCLQGLHLGTKDLSVALARPQKDE